MNTVNASVQGAFSDTVQKIAGETQLQVTAGEFGFDETVLERVQAVPEVGVAVPVIEATAETDLPGQGTLLILGVDMTGDRSLRDYSMESADEAIIEDPLVFLAQPDSLMVTREFAERNGFQVNSRIPLHTLEGDKFFTIRGVMRSSGMNKAFGGNLAVMDIYAAQLVFGRGRRFDRVDIRAREGIPVEECRKAVQDALGPGYDVAPPSSRSEHFAALMQNYTLATQISSLFALVVGMFIIYNSFAIAVTHRRTEIGILRALGATRKQIQRVFLLESLLAGLVGSLIGAVGGMIVARALATTMGNLTEQIVGVAQRTNEIVVSPWLLAVAVVVGVATSVVAAWIPARSASTVDPVQALQKGKYQVMSAGENRKRRLAGIACAAVSLGTLYFASWKLAFYAGYLLIIGAGLLFVPTLTLILSRAIRPLLRRLLPVEGTLAADSLIQSPRRTSATVAALMLSLAMAMGFGGVTYSMRSSIEEWMSTALNPDFFVTTSATNLVSRSATFPEHIGPVVQAVPGVRDVQLVRNARIMYRKIPVMLVAIETERIQATAARKPIAGDPDEMYRLTAQGKGVIISDAFQAYRQLKVGDVIDLPAPGGILALPVVGVVRDYTDMQGAIFIDRSVYVREWKDTTVNLARVYVDRGEEPAKVRDRIQRALDGNLRLIILSNAEIRDYVFDLVEQWFSMSRVQIVVAVLVAVLGIVNTLTVSITDRRREIGVVQAVGGLRLQVRRTIWLEALSIGGIGLLLGIGMGMVNIYYTLGMVRRDLGGLDLDYVFPTSMAIALIPVILAAAFIASIGPAESAVRGSLVEALEYE
jgi:putative ABC transport system permease protein